MRFSQQGIDVNPVGELALLRYALAGLIDASVALGRDAALRAKWNETLCHLAPYPAETLPDGGGPVFLEVIKRNSSIAPAMTSPCGELNAPLLSHLIKVLIKGK